VEISRVRQRVLQTLDRAKRAAAERRAQTDEASREFDAFLEHIAVPLFRQVANALKAAGHHFTVFTPGGSVRLMSDKSSEDFVELALDSTGRRPLVMGHTSRARARRVVESERPVAEGPIREITEDQVLSFLLEELESLVER
jgi:hypothetical protein